MADVLYAFLGSDFVGTFTRSGRMRITFRYDEGYRWSSGATPISLSMPLTTDYYTGEEERLKLTVKDAESWISES
jgi:HipA-like protein